MKFFLALALLVPALAQADMGTLTRQIAGGEALRLWNALGTRVSLKNKDVREFSSSSVKIECTRSPAQCSVSLRDSGEKSGYLYRDTEARELYEALDLEEYEGRLGYTKVYSDIDSGLEILCSRFRGAEGETFSCSIDLGR